MTRANSAEAARKTLHMKHRRTGGIIAHQKTARRIRILLSGQIGTCRKMAVTSSDYVTALP